LSQIKQLQGHESADINCFYKLSTGEYKPIRIVVMKKDGQAIEKSNRKLKKRASRMQMKPAQPETVLHNEYIVLATNLDFTNEQILELYRARWQIEKVFHRLKSLFEFGEIPNKNYNSVMAWFYGKLLLAALCEAIVRTECFSPKEEKLFFGFTSQKFME
jgi:transposase